MTSTALKILLSIGLAQPRRPTRAVRAECPPEPLTPGGRRPRWERSVMRGIDVVGAAVGLALLAPPMLIIAGIIRLTGRGPALFRQRRVGQGGKPFTLYKFRTMRLGCSEEPLREMIARELRGEDTSADGSFKLDRDPRITAVGSWLRRTSLDELPQLLNVLRGDMALVGPRPCLEWEAAMFPPEFADRSAVKPGLTGLWQVSGRSTMATLDMLRLDLVYVRSRSLRTDLGILARTLPSMLRGDGAR
ncbi:sugar transferase [Saccharopolyspora sp. ASAGF58]|uniref:sugar transferase n=1 Tax=Saccharopolyspora sp. ASAGF58 TaxID=2719023 RepID=UPI001FF0A02A|nr:sugar transferase [Saccharopolyspora sp. ASAGF58]